MTDNHTPPDITIEEQRAIAARDARMQEVADSNRAKAAAKSANGGPSTARELSFQEAEGACACGAPAMKFRMHFKSSDDNKPWTQKQCDACIARADWRRTEDERQERFANARRIARDALRVPPLYAAATLANFQLTGDVDNQERQRGILARATEFVSSWPDAPMISLFVGGYGTGKGHVAWSICNALVETYGALCRVAVLPDVIRDLRENWGVRRDDDSESEVQRLAKYRSVDLLVVDEVSRHAFYGQPQQHLYDLVAWREQNMKPTIITTNESGQELAEYLGGALTSRALGYGAAWDFGTVDYRVLRGRRAS